MKTLTFISLFLSFNALAVSYDCVGPKDTVLESFKITKLSATEFDAELDGNTDGLPEEKSGVLEFVFNNGCDNNAMVRIRKSVAEDLPQNFNLRMDYEGPEDMLYDTEVICHKTAE